MLVRARLRVRVTVIRVTHTVLYRSVGRVFWWGAVGKSVLTALLSSSLMYGSKSLINKVSVT